MTYQDELPILYIKSGCARCRAAVAFLDGNGVAHRERNISDDPVALVDLRRLDRTVPTPALAWEDELLTNFNVEQLVDFLHARNVELEES